MKKHLALFAAVAVLAGGVAWAADERPAPGRKETAPRNQRVGVEEFDKLRANKNHVVLDVRTGREFKAGHIPGAVNIDANAPDFAEKVAKLDKNKTYLVHCAAGGRSARACKQLEGIGFKELYDLAPGFNAWQKAGKPVEKGNP
jgi:phage shock protein E